MLDNAHSLLGYCAFLLIAWLLGERRRAVKWRIVAAGVALQFLFAVLLLFVPGFKDAVLSLNGLVRILEDATIEGASFMFGYLAGSPPPFEVTEPQYTYVLAFRVLPIVLVVSALSAVLFYWGLLPLLIRGFALVLERGLRISGPLGFAAGSSVFLGTIESPILVRPYLPIMTRSEIFAMMTCIMATVAGSVMVLYASVLAGAVPDAIGHILVASVVSVPAALVVAYLMIPFELVPEAERIELPKTADSTLDALMRGIADGVRICVSIAAVIIVLFAIVYLINAALGLFPGSVTLEGIFALVFRPFVWLMGIPWDEAGVAARYMGIKTVLNEFVAYVELGADDGAGLSNRSRLILTYALCGFANFGSFGIMVGGMSAIVPERREEFAALGLRSLLSGTIATMMTGSIIGLLT